MSRPFWSTPCGQCLPYDGACPKKVSWVQWYIWCAPYNYWQGHLYLGGTLEKRPGALEGTNDSHPNAWGIRSIISGAALAHWKFHASCGSIACLAEQEVRVHSHVPGWQGRILSIVCDAQQQYEKRWKVSGASTSKIKNKVKCGRWRSMVFLRQRVICYT